MYAYAADVSHLSSVQGPFSAAPCQALTRDSQLLHRCIAPTGLARCASLAPTRLARCASLSTRFLSRGSYHQRVARLVVRHQLLLLLAHHGALLLGARDDALERVRHLTKQKCNTDFSRVFNRVPTLKFYGVFGEVSTASLTPNRARPPHLLLGDLLQVAARRHDGRLVHQVLQTEAESM
jgi:hypothetical protein